MIHLAFAAVLAIGPALAAPLGTASLSAGIENLLGALLGGHGLLYNAPLLWCGFLGWLPLRRERPGLARLTLAAILPGVLSLALVSDSTSLTTRSVSWLPFLLPGLAHCFQKAQSVTARHPGRATAAAGALLVLWNVLFIEQYRRRFLPSDETVSFAKVTSNSASILSGSVGTPFAWPANWLFASRIKASPDRWEAAAGRDLFGSEDARLAAIELGDDDSVTSSDSTLRLDGFGDPRTCERGFCRDLYDEGRVLIPLRNAGRSDFVIRVRARGVGQLKLSLNERSTSVSEMSETLSDLSLTVPARLLRPGISVLSLAVVGGGRATIDRITLERDPASGSAR